MVAINLLDICILRALRVEFMYELVKKIIITSSNSSSVFTNFFKHNPIALICKIAIGKHRFIMTGKFQMCRRKKNWDRIQSASMSLWPQNIEYFEPIWKKMSHVRKHVMRKGLILRKVKTRASPSCHRTCVWCWCLWIVLAVHVAIPH